MASLESITQKEEALGAVILVPEKPLRKAERFLRTAALGAGIALKCTAWYIGGYQAIHYASHKEYKKAAVSHASGYIPGVIGFAFLGFAGFSYSKDLYKIVKKKLKK